MENLELLREKYPPRKVENQMEFERIMQELKDDKESMKQPLIDLNIRLKRRFNELELQRIDLRMEMERIRNERLDNEKGIQEINSKYRELRNEFCKRNPREDFIREESVV